MPARELRRVAVAVDAPDLAAVPLRLLRDRVRAVLADADEDRAVRRDRRDCRRDARPRRRARGTRCRTRTPCSTVLRAGAQIDASRSRHRGPCVAAPGRVVHDRRGVVEQRHAEETAVAAGLRRQRRDRNAVRARRCGGSTRRWSCSRSSPCRVGDDRADEPRHVGDRLDAKAGQRARARAPRRGATGQRRSLIRKRTLRKNRASISEYT